MWPLESNHYVALSVLYFINTCCCELKNSNYHYEQVHINKARSVVMHRTC